MPRLRDQAVCIRLQEWSETSQIVVLMSEHHGKLRGLAKGSKRDSPSSRQRFSGGLALLTRGEVLATLRPSRDLASVTEWDLQSPYPHLHQDLEAQRLGLYAADGVHALMAEQDAHPRTFHVLVRFLEELREKGSRSAALLRFQWDLLEDAGYRPQLEGDIRTGEPLNPHPPHAIHFDPRAGGFTYKPGPRNEDWRVRDETLTLLRQTAEGELQGHSPRDPFDRANRLLAAYLRVILDRELPTMRHILSKQN